MLSSSNIRWRTFLLWMTLNLRSFETNTHTGQNTTGQYLSLIVAPSLLKPIFLIFLNIHQDRIKVEIIKPSPLSHRYFEFLAKKFRRDLKRRGVPNEEGVMIKDRDWPVWLAVSLSFLGQYHIANMTGLMNFVMEIIRLFRIAFRLLD